MERQRDCYDLQFFLANSKQTFGQSSQLQLENSRCLRPGRNEEPPEPRDVSAAAAAAASGNCSSLRVPAQRRPGRNNLNPSVCPRWEPGRGLRPPLPQLLPPVKSQMRLWRLWRPGGGVAAVGEQQSPASLLETHRLLPKSSLR